MYPGVAKAYDLRERFNHEYLGQAVPEFPDGIESRRVLYLDTHIYHGPMRAGGTGEMTSFVFPFCRMLVDRYSDKRYGSKCLQIYWKNNRHRGYVPHLKPAPCPLVYEGARVGFDQIVSVPVMNIPWPDPMPHPPMVLEGHGGFERAHGVYEAALTDLGNLAVPNGLNWARCSAIVNRNGLKYQGRYQHWLGVFVGFQSLGRLLKLEFCGEKNTHFG